MPTNIPQLEMGNAMAAQDLMNNQDLMTDDVIERVLQEWVKFWTDPLPHGVSYPVWALQRFDFVESSMRLGADGGELHEDTESAVGWKFEEVVFPEAKEKLEEQLEKRLKQLYKMEFILRTQGEINFNSENRDKLARSYHALRLAYDTIECEFAAKIVFDEDLFQSSNMPRHLSIHKFGYMFRPADHTPSQELLLFFYQKLMEKGYRRFDADCYEEIKYNNIGTHAWQQVMTIEEFVYKNQEKDHNYEIWLLATKASNTNRFIVDQISKCEDQDFPCLKQERTLLSFRNGQVDIENMIPRFFPAGSGRLEYSRASLKFFDCEYNEDVFCEANSKQVQAWDPRQCAMSTVSLLEWRDIKTDLFEGIFTHQEYTSDTIELVYAMLGRLLYPVGALDDWQVVPFFKGVAGCGKSTVALAIAEMFPSNMVATISANMEGTFGLQNIVNNMVCLCTEVTKKFPLDRGVWQSMVTGENVTVPRKNNTAIDARWEVPMAMFGNETPQYDDKSGSVFRRMALFSMRKCVDQSQVDPTLLKKLKENIATLLMKCNLAYRELATRYGHKSFWAPEIATEQMQQWHREVLLEIDAFSGFLHSSHIERDPEYYIAYEELKRQYLKWCKEELQQKTPQVLTLDHLASACGPLGIKSVVCAKPWPTEKHAPKQMHFLLGIRMAVDDHSLITMEVTDNVDNMAGVDFN